MFKKAISWLLILALLCSGTVLSIFAEGQPATDAAAVDAGYHFKYTKDGSVQYGKIAESGVDTSMAAVPDGATVTLLQDVGIDAQNPSKTAEVIIRTLRNMTIDGNGYAMNAKLLCDNGRNDLTIKNVKFAVKLADGYMVQVQSGNSCVFENCEFDIEGAPSYGAIIARGNVTFKNSSVKYTTATDKSLFFNEANNSATVINTTFDLSGAPNAMVGLGFGTNNTYYTNMSTAMSKANAGDTLTLAADYKSNGTDAERLFNFKDNLTIDGNGHTLSAASTSWLIRAEKSATIRNLTVVQQGTAAAMQVNDGAAVTLDRVTIQCTNASSFAVVLRGTLVFNAGSKLLAGDAEQAANGFHMDQPSGVLIVNRGAEINVSGKLYSTKHATATATVNGGTFTVGGKLLYRDPTTEEFKNNEVTLRLPNGGVATKNNSGIRFTTVVDKAWYDAMLAAGVTVVKTGTLVAPKAFVDAAGAFTPEALAAADKLYLDIVNDGWYNGTSDDDFYFYYGNMVKLSAASISGELAGIGYMVVTVEGLGTFTVYGTQQSGIVSVIAAGMTGTDAAQNEILEFFRGSAN